MEKYEEHSCNVCAEVIQVEVGSYGTYECPHCEFTTDISLIPKRNFGIVNFAPLSLNTTTQRMIAENLRGGKQPNGKIDQSYLDRGKECITGILNGEIPELDVVNNHYFRKITGTDEVSSLINREGKELSIAVIALLLGIGFMFVNPVCGGVLLIASCISLIITPIKALNLTKEYAMISRNGAVEVGHLGAIVPKSRLLLGFSWFDNKVDIKTCRYIPVEHEVVLRQTTHHGGGDHSTYTQYYTDVSIRIRDSPKSIPIATMYGQIKECRKQMESSSWGRFFDGPIIEIEK